MKDDSSFVLKSGMFATCSGTWDEKSQTYRDSDSTEVMKCCVANCIKPVKFCYKYCHDNHGPGQEFDSPIKLDRCMETCGDERDMCLDTCSLSSPHVGMKNNYLQCALQHCEGGIGNYPSKECIEKHKDKLFECCRRSCIPTHNLDCQKHCEYIQSIMVRTDTTGVPQQIPTLNTLTSKFKSYSDHTHLYIIGGVILSMVVIIAWLIISRKN